MRFLIPMLAFLMASLAQPLSAQDQDPYDRLIAALTPEGMNEITFEKVLQDVEASFRADPNWTVIEGQCEGTLEATLTESRPLLWEYHLLEATILSERIGSILRENLSEQHASQAADLYGSDLGQRLILTMASNFSMRSTVDTLGGDIVAAGSDDVPLDRKAFERDQRMTVARTVSALSPEEREEFAQKLAGQQWFTEYSKLLPQISQARFDIANSELQPGFQDRINTAMEAAATAYFEKCED